MALEVFFTADDFGLSAQVNEAMVHSHEKGVLQGVSLMMGQPGTEEAVQLARERPRLKVGFHLHLCDSQPTTCPRWPWGESPAKAGWAIGLSREARNLVVREIENQWSLFTATGLPGAFLNTHHHLHAHPFVLRRLVEIVPRDFPGWLRLGRPRWFENKHAAARASSAAGMMLLQKLAYPAIPWPTSDTLWGLDRLLSMKATEVANAVRHLDHGFHEFMFHPRRIANDPDTKALVELKSLLQRT